MFTERAGGVSRAPWDSLNLGSNCGDDPAAVEENRRRALEAAGAGDIAERLLTPRQVHGDHLVTVRSSEPSEISRAREEASAGCDGIVCVAKGVPVLLCFADCVPVVLAAPGAFAVVHSGWRGTMARISAKAVRALCAEAGCGPSAVSAYLGPHIAGEDYEVSEELLRKFEDEFGTMVRVGGRPRNLSLAGAIVDTLTAAGVKPCQILDARASTATNVDRFYSYRAEHGRCGRHAAIAFL